jgi:hypothetical protein
MSGEINLNQLERIQNEPRFTVSACSPPDKPAYVHWASNTSKTDIQR